MTPKKELDFLTQMLGIEGMRVKEQQFMEGCLFLKIESEDKRATCPKCGHSTNKLHQNHWHLIKDLPVGEKQVYLRSNRRRMRCEKCGKIFSEKLSYVKEKRSYTERLRQKVLKEVLSSDIKSTARRNNVSETEIETMLNDLKREYSERKPKGIKRLGIDEIAVVKGQKNYCAVLVDIERREIICLLESRQADDIIKHLRSWGEEVLSGIEEVSIDLWEAYKKVAKVLMPEATIVADRFHVMKHVNQELDVARKATRRQAEKLSDQTEKDRILSSLKKSKYALLKNPENLTEKQAAKLAEIQEHCPELSRKYQRKEEFRQIFEESKDWTEGSLRLADWLRESLTDFPDSCGTIRRWFGEIIAYFDHRTTQGVVEGINNKLKLIKRRAYGFRNIANFQVRCVFS
ncbi:ISL3 family transposase [bacterium]|nr:ISL3 family transposase [bacterium]